MIALHCRTGEPAPGASEESAFMSLEDFEAAQKEKQRNTSFDVRKPGEGVNQFEGMRKINSSKVNEPSSSNTYPNNPLSSVSHLSYNYVIFVSYFYAYIQSLK